MPVKKVGRGVGRQYGAVIRKIQCDGFNQPGAGFEYAVTTQRGRPGAVDGGGNVCIREIGQVCNKRLPFRALRHVATVEEEVAVAAQAMADLGQQPGVGLAIGIAQRRIAQVKAALGCRAKQSG